METIVDWLMRTDHTWVAVGIGLLIAVFGAYLTGRRLDRNRAYRHRGVEAPAPICVRVDQSGDSATVRSVSWNQSHRKGALSVRDRISVFHFRFGGNARRGRALIRERKIQLIFAQGAAATLLESVSFTGRKFLALLKEEAQLFIVIWPGEGIDLNGSGSAIASFRDGILLDEVVFDLLVTKDCPDEVQVTAEFFAGGTKLYGLTFSTRVQSADEWTESEPTSLPRSVVNLDVVAALNESGSGNAKVAGAGDGDLLLTLELVPGGLMMNLVHTTAEAGMVSVGKALNADLDRASLQTLLTQIRVELGEAFYVSDVWNRSTLLPLSAQEREDMADCFDRVASAGSILNRALRSNNVDVAKLFNYIEARPSGTRLTIATSKVFLPFEILYPHQFNIDLLPEERGEGSVVRGDFWGVRFGLEIAYVGAGDYLALVRTHRRAPRKVSLNLNKTIIGAGSPTPMQIHGKLEGDLKARNVACDSSSQCDQMKRILLGAGSGARLVYVYCHGSAADPDAGSIEELHLNNDRCVVRPTAVSGDQYTNAPIVFLNACYSGAASPMFFTGFLESFRSKGALGLIATSFPVPVMFGAQFGADVVAECMFGSGSLSERVRRMRRLHADQGNPVPLFYSVQCQLSI